MVEAVRRIGRRRGWPDTWLNEEAAPTIPRGRDGRAGTVYGDRNLVVTAASAEHLLAMKVHAARPKDQEDIAFLAKRWGSLPAGRSLTCMTKFSLTIPRRGAASKTLARS